MCTNSNKPAPKMNPPEEIKRDIELLLFLFKTSKSFFMFINKDDIGKIEIGPYKIREELEAYVRFDKEISEEIRELNNSVGHYLNQNFIIRLYSLLNYHNVLGSLKKLDKNVPGWEDIDILRRLRHKFGHALGKYNKGNGDDLKLWESIQTKYKPGIPETEDYAINQDKVINPIIKSIYRYIDAKYRMEN